MKTPAHRFVAYLLAVGLADDEVNHILAKDGFPILEADELSRARYELDLPKGFDPHDLKHEPSMEWVRARGLSGVFQGKDAAVEAFRLLRSPARLPVEVLLLGGMDAVSIATFLAKHKAGDFSDNAVGRFASMFFAVTEMSGDDLVKFARQAPNGEAYLELMARGPDAAVELAERLLQRTATWPWARRAIEATAPVSSSTRPTMPPVPASTNAHPT